MTMETNWQFSLDRNDLNLTAMPGSSRAATDYFKKGAERMATTLGRELVSVRDVESIMTADQRCMVGGTVILGEPLNQGHKLP